MINLEVSKSKPNWENQRETSAIFDSGHQTGKHGNLPRVSYTPVFSRQKTLSDPNNYMSIKLPILFFAFALILHRY
uniref:Uncharacterized protein n=1 Tax=Anguilla anguilla TaxID=7936 RepID=A0A0E9XN38_ANGAN